MEKKKFKLGLVSKLIIAIIIGIGLGSASFITNRFIESFNNASKLVW